MQVLAHRQLQPPRILRLAVVLLLFLVVQSAFALPFLQTRANLNPRIFYRSVGSLAGVVISGSRHIVGSFETLYQLHQLAIATPQTEGSFGAAANSASGSSRQVMICEYHAMPSQGGTAYGCPTSSRSAGRSSSNHRC
jgi:hypothetical protein